MMFKALAVAALASLVVGQATPLASVKVEFEVSRPVRYLSTTPEGRTFLIFMQNSTSQGVLVEHFANNGTTKAYPSEEWNDHAPQHIIGAIAQRIGPDGHLYVLDAGIGNFSQIPTGGQPAKLLQIDLSSNSVTKVWELKDFTRPQGYLIDFRFNKKVVYISDEGAPAIIVLNLETGRARRVLDNAESTKAHFPLSAEGRLLKTPAGLPAYIGVFYMEVDPQNTHLYFQPGSGGMNRIETQYMEADGINDTALEARVEPFALTPPSGGTAIDSQGNIYTTDIDYQRVIKITPDGQQSEIARDPRLLYANLWIDSSKKMFITCSQVNRLPDFHNGKSLIQGPFQVYSIDIGAGPSSIDHA